MNRLFSLETALYRSKGAFEYWNSIKIEPVITQMKGGDVNLRDVT
jgi:hypothetical protein